MLYLYSVSLINFQGKLILLILLYISFFSSIIIEWNNIDPHLRKSENFSVFKSNILKSIRPSPNSAYNCHNPRRICLITRLRLGLSHLRQHKFKHGFQDT